MPGSKLLTFQAPNFYFLTFSCAIIIVGATARHENFKCKLIGKTVQPGISRLDKNYPTQGLALNENDQQTKYQCFKESKPMGRL